MIKKIQFLCRISIPESFDNRRSDLFIPNGVYSDLVLLLWCIAGAFLLCLGYWKSVFGSFLVIVFILKVVDVLGRKFGHNILRTNQEMPFYPLRLLSILRKTLNTLYLIIKYEDSDTVKLHTATGILLQLCDSCLVHRINPSTRGVGRSVATGKDGTNLHRVCRHQRGSN